MDDNFNLKEFTMKKFFKLFGIIAFVAIIGFSMAACDSGGDDGGLNLTGTTWTSTQDGDTFTLTFTTDTTARLEYPGGTFNGTYTLNGNSGTITWTYGTVYNFVVNGNTLTATVPGNPPVTFVKGTGGTGGNVNTSLDGVWERGGMQVTVSGSTGVYSYLNSSNASSLTLDAINKDYLKIGNQAWRNLTSTGNLTWSGQSFRIQYYTSNPNVAIGTTWGSSTFIMSANGQTLTVDGSETWTRVSTYSLDGVWEGSNGMRITVVVSTGTITYLGYPSALWTDAVNKNYVKVGDQIWRNLSSTGNLTWSGQNLRVLSYDSNVAVGTTWGNCTFTMSANGQTLTAIAADSSGTSTLTYTRQTTSGSGGSGSGGTFTLTDIPPEYNGKYAYFYVSLNNSDYILFGAQSINITTTMVNACMISNGSVSLPIWKVRNDEYNAVRYSGNDTVDYSLVYIHDDASMSVSESSVENVIFYSITFSNGNATISWNEREY
jgi:hypothetical protein